jgi:hypothetical protein
VVCLVAYLLCLPFVQSSAVKYNSTLITCTHTDSTHRIIIMLSRPRPIKERGESISFENVQPEEASGVLEDVLRDNEVYLGGGSIGKGLKKAARFFLQERLSKAPLPEHFELHGAEDLEADIDVVPLEESFYVIDIGVVVSQVYQWRRCFPRVEPFCKLKRM